MLYLSAYFRGVLAGKGRKEVCDGYVRLCVRLIVKLLGEASGGYKVEGTLVIRSFSLVEGSSRGKGGLEPCGINVPVHLGSSRGRGGICIRIF